MNAITIRELNANISKAIARVEAGETLDILKNGKIVAELRPKPRERDAAWHAAYREMVERMDRGLALGIGRVDPKDKYGDADL